MGFSLQELITRAIFEDQYSGPARGAVQATEELGDAVDATADAGGRMNMQMLSAGFAMQRVSMLFTAAASAMASGISTVVKAGDDLDYQMHYTNTMAGLTSAGLNELTDQTKNLAINLGGVDAEEVGRGLFMVESAGYRGADALTEVSVASKLAIAGQAEMNDVSHLLVGVMHNFGYNASQATEASDKLFATAKTGLVHFRDLSQVMGIATATAGRAGVPLEEVGAAFAVMTRAQFSPHMSAMAVNRSISALLKPSKDMNDIIHSAGFESGETLLKTKGLAGAIDILATATGGSAEKLAELGMNERALRGFMATTANGAKEYKQILQEIKGSGGITEKNYHEMMGSSRMEWKQLITDLRAIAHDFFEVMRPALMIGGAVIHGLLTFFHNLPMPIKAVIVLITVMTTAILGVLGAVTGLAAYILLIIPGITFAVSQLSSNWWAVTAAITAASTAMKIFSGTSTVATIEGEAAAAATLGQSGTARGLGAGAAFAGWLTTKAPWLAKTLGVTGSAATALGGTGIFSKLWGGFKASTPWAIAGTAASMGTDYLANNNMQKLMANPQDGSAKQKYLWEKTISGVLSGASTGAMIGGMLGNIIPIPGVGAGIGMAIGALVGGAYGGWKAYTGANSMLADTGVKSGVQEAVDQSNQHLANIEANTASMKDYMRKFTFGSGKNLEHAVKDRDILNAFFKSLQTGVV